MKNIYIKFICILSIFALFSCDKEDGLREESIIYVDQVHESEFDKWLYETFTVPYNMEIKWKWDDSEVDNNFHVTPPRKEKAEQFMKALYKIWIKPYEEVGGEEFIKTYVPKLIYLVGTPQYNDDGTMTLGLAEGGRKVSVFDVDSFDNLDLERMSKSFHTMHHEFAHILHQKISYPTEYMNLSKGNYTGAWYNYGELEANTLGFISPYSMSKHSEDFVEIVATILTTVQNSNTPIERTVPEKNEYGIVTGNLVNMLLTDFQLKLYMCGIGLVQNKNGSLTLKQDQSGPRGLSILLEKIDIITEYYKTEWGIDLFELQGKIEIATNELILENSEE
ncbi:substrate import-associated zinc metallohydrolase lipoprotein [Ancylomarina subtilis]|uniref:Substrate import-associated zinc metallohydrolase lipoprotein n=1 Tax=Ancylomarina subtilis TaxID=1639035 RepID=A0A4Q7VJS2_9BACT|nr:substrate import-associated zinc metallohydrolase lipoprotein [Ancylomarina subtilis]RZT96433.1 substrate import-associated zinc metallohydrolase lipoprotein [Ancylomarina subtilis]